MRFLGVPQSSQPADVSFARAKRVRNRNLNYSTIRNAYHYANEVHGNGRGGDEIWCVVNRQWHFWFFLERYHLCDGEHRGVCDGIVLG